MNQGLTLACILMLILTACGDESENPIYEQSEPAKPTGLSATLEPNGVKLSWNSSEHAAKYWVFRKAGEQVSRIAATHAMTEFLDTAVADGATYDYWVRGLSAGDESGDGLLGIPSEVQSVTFCAPKLELLGDGRLDFGQDKMTLQLAFRNCGGGKIRWAILNGAPWVKFTPSSGEVGQDATTVAVEVDRRACEAKAYEGLARLGGTVGPPIDLRARMVIPNEPVLAVEPEILQLCPEERKDIRIGNTGTGTLSWRISGGAGRIQATPTDGSISCGESTVVHLSTLEEISSGDNSVDLRVSSDEMEESILVTLLKPKPEDLMISPNRIELRERNTWTSAFTLTNLGLCNLPVEVDSTPQWLDIRPQRIDLLPNTSQELQLRTNAQVERLDARLYTTFIRFRLPLGTHQPEVEVNFRRIGQLRGRYIDVFTQREIPDVEVVTDVGSAHTANKGDFVIPYEREGAYNWCTTHPDYLPRDGTVVTARGIGTIGDIFLIPIPRVTGEVISAFEFDTPWTIALSEDERQVAIVNRDGGFVSLVDTARNRVDETVEVGTHPLGAVYTANELFVANNFDRTVSVIDPFDQKRVVRTIENLPLPAYLATYREKLFVSLQDAVSGNRIAVVDIGTGVTESLIQAGQFPHGVAVDSGGRFLYVANHDNGTVMPVTLPATRAPLIDVGPNPIGVTFSPNGKHVYVAAAGEVSQIDAERKIKFSQFIQKDARFTWIAVVQMPEGQGDLVYVTDTVGNQVWMWHPQSGEFAPINVSAGPVGIAATRDGRRVYVCSAEANRVEVLETQ